MANRKVPINTATISSNISEPPPALKQFALNITAHSQEILTGLNQANSYPQSLQDDEIQQIETAMCHLGIAYQALEKYCTLERGIRYDEHFTMGATVALRRAFQNFLQFA